LSRKKQLAGGCVRAASFNLTIGVAFPHLFLGADQFATFSKQMTWTGMFDDYGSGVLQLSRRTDVFCGT
jgi:hypothetical protein